MVQRIGRRISADKNIIINYTDRGVSATSTGLVNPSIKTYDIEEEEEVAAQFHDDTGAIAHWQCDGDLTDQKGTEDINETPIAGTLRWAPAAVPGSRALFLDGSTRLVGKTDPAPAALRITGDITVMMMLKPTGLQSGTAGLPFACSGLFSSDASAENQLWIPQVYASSNYIALGWEYDSGTNSGLDTSANVFSIHAGAWCHVAFTVDTSGGAGATICKIYANGIERATSSTLTPTSDGGNAQILVGGADIAGWYFSGLVSTVIVFNSVKSASDVLAAARRCLPPDLRPAS